MAGWQIWIIVGIAFFILEIFTPGFLVASIGVGAFLASIASAFGWSLAIQIVALALGVVLSLILIRPLLYKRSKGVQPQPTGVEALIGKDALVLEDIRNAQNKGRVRIGNEDWKALSEEGIDIDRNVQVTVARITGATAYVYVKKER
ncbi:MAG: NfeD family protein [Spirochaetae bacterium HGW-Spirochaetae-8]|jgi:membrane protein implicated in regulation of membrane protease activity|nr:MAG: NfeD family protein [Spirochaetae bacterium HGW-Spirochaetae-8]